MADIANPTGHVATYNDLLTTTAADGDVYITDDTHEAYQFSGQTVSWAMIGSATSVEPPPAETQSAEPPPAEPPPEVQPTGGTVGSAVAGTTTLDALVAAALANKSADLAGAISYVWYTPTRVIGTFPSATSNTGKCACVRVTVEPQVHAPSSWLP